MVKKTTITLVLISLLMLNACSDGSIKNEALNTQEETPAILENNSKAIDLSSISKRYNSDIIKSLFDEAMDKDPELKDLVNKIDQIDQLKNDSLKSYNKYLQNNNAYWSAADRYIEQITDTVLKTEMVNTFNSLKESYLKSIKPHTRAIEELEEKTKQLTDYDIILSLIVSEKMIANYQKNELPDIESISKLTGIYDTLINDTKQYIEIEK